MRLPKSSLKFIKNSNSSYTTIQKKLKKKFGVEISKSLLSYYKRKKSRLIKLNFNKLTTEETDWLNGIFIADGCKYKTKSYDYTIKFALDNMKDKEIANKLCYIFEKLGCKYSFYNQKNALIIKTYSKQFFEKLPTKNILFKPKNEEALLAGLIDGDGCKQGNSAVLVQYNNIETMKYLSKILNFKQKIFPVSTNFGLSIRRQYYIPKHICDSLKNKELSIKLNNHLTISKAK